MYMVLLQGRTNWTVLKFERDEAGRLDGVGRNLAGMVKALCFNSPYYADFIWAALLR